MSKKHTWFVAFIVVAFLLAACGPEMATPTARAPETTATSPEATGAADATPTAGGVSPGDLPVDPNDWRTLGAPDAPVTIVEYSDFQ